MKKSVLALLISAALVASVGCSNWNRMTPAPLDNKAMEAEVVKNLAADHINNVNVNVSDGVVTLSGHATASDRDKAVQDARKVSGVKSVVDNISTQ
jgi:osmotically-inducible protein OsmY